jgi:hypothetical protein
MTARQPRYSKEEFARRGDAIYETQVRSQVEEGNRGKIVAIDIETGAFEVTDNIPTATERLFARYSDAQPWIVRIGHRAVYRFGARSLQQSI